MKAINRNCPICYTEQVLELIELDVYDFDDVSLDEDLIIVACENCGMIYNDIHANDDDLDSYYENDAVYDSVQGIGSGGTVQWDIDRYTGYIELFDSISIRRDISLVDVGCAKGGFLAYLKQNGFTDVSGVEINPRCAQYALSNYFVKVDIGTANKLPLPSSSKDLITYNHVFEHVNDLYRVLKEADRVLSEDGLLFIDVPDGSRYGECSISNFYMASIQEHINHFDIYHLKMALKFAGFDCVKCTQQFASSTSRFVFPTISGLFKKSATGRPSQPFEFKYNGELINSYVKYIDDSNIALNKTHQLVSEIARSNKSVYIWGLGLEFFGLYSMAGLKECNIKKLIDKNVNKQSRKVDGLEVASPEALLNVPENSVVFLTSAQHQHDMLDYLKSIRFKGEVFSLC